MHSAQQIMFDDANFLVDIDTAAKTLLSIGNTIHHVPGAWYKWCNWCMVNCTLFDIFQSSLRENKFDNTMSDVLIAICCSVWRKVKDVARHCAVLCIFALLHKRVDTNVQ